jgi:outer membrane protein TolC
VLFLSQTGAAAGNFLPSVTITGQAGETGTSTLSVTLGPYTDYQVRWEIQGTGAISVDDI